MGKKPKNNKNRKNKITLVFDEEKRREFLTGFHKRKLQRKKKAQEELQEQLKAERKRLKQEAKESYKNLVVSHRPIPELEHLYKEEYEDDGVSVQVMELSENSIAKQNNWIGPNKPQYEENDKENSENEDSDTEEIEGMELKQKKISSKTIQKELPVFKTEKDVKKLLKKQATKNVQKSKPFQIKHKLEKQKMKKKSLQQKRLRAKVQGKKGKHLNK
ncbi:ribosomal RNA-processing protein 17 [Chrysoperla carnea]|uniref:ribosomal RNA-processing protein 17 n=1 Tax=Chrysoperla carnea TaxID=189513 RepID=UPI001D0711CE|nr:ribosomal RNA-processing protein 17 [Chrysoperla carnea]